MRKTKIICTLGPAVDHEETIRQLILAGMNAARFNFSHGTHESHRAQLLKLHQPQALSESVVDVGRGRHLIREHILPTGQNDRDARLVPLVVHGGVSHQDARHVAYLI